MKYIQKTLVIIAGVSIALGAYAVTTTQSSEWSGDQPVCKKGNIEKRSVSENCPFFTQWMKKGDQDGKQSVYRQKNGSRATVTEVAKLQEWLNTYFNTNIAVDGIFGSETESAVKKYQNEYKEYILNPWNASWGNQPTGNFKNTSRWFGNYLMSCVEDPVGFDLDQPGTYQPFESTNQTITHLEANQEKDEYRCVEEKKDYIWDRPDFHLIRRSGKKGSSGGSGGAGRGSSGPIGNSPTAINIVSDRGAGFDLVSYGALGCNFTYHNLSTVDIDPGDTHTYSFCGGPDDSWFQIIGNVLRRTADPVNVLMPPYTLGEHTVCIRTTDAAGNYFEQLLEEDGTHPLFNSCAGRR